MVADAEPVSTLLTGKTLEVVNICSRSHHHLKGRDHLLLLKKDKLKARNLISLYLSTSSTVAGGAKKPEVVALAQQQVPLRVQRLTNLEKNSL